MELTKKQKEVLMAIRKIIAEKGVSPTFRELQEKLGYSTIGSVQRHITALKKKKYIAVEKHQRRSMSLNKNISKKSHIPLVGVITCGQPILSFQNIEAYVPFEVKGDSRDYFFVRAEGDSMNMAGIDNGDLVLIKKQNSAQPGDKIVALIGDEVTIKVYKEGRNCIILEPKSSNPIHKPIYILENFEDFMIQGKVIDKIKT